MGNLATHALRGDRKVVDPKVGRLLIGLEAIEPEHEKRNLAEYEGYLEPDDQLLSDVLAATKALAARLGENEHE